MRGQKRDDRQHAVVPHNQQGAAAAQIAADGDVSGVAAEDDVQHILRLFAQLHQLLRVERVVGVRIPVAVGHRVGAVVFLVAVQGDHIRRDVLIGRPLVGLPVIAVGDILDVKVLLRPRGDVQPLGQHLIDAVGPQRRQVGRGLVVQILLKPGKQRRVDVHHRRLAKQLVVGLLDKLPLVKEGGRLRNLALLDGALGGQQHEVGGDAALVGKGHQRLDVALGLLLVRLADVLHQDVVPHIDAVKLLCAADHLQFDRQRRELVRKGEVLRQRLLKLLQIVVQLVVAVEGRKAAAPKQQRPDPRRTQQQRQDQPRQNLSFGHAVPPFLYTK